MTAPIPHIIRQQTGPLGDRHVTQYWLSDGTCLRSEARTPDTANLNVAWAYREAAERARHGGDVPEPFVPSGPVAFANPRDVMLVRALDLLGTYKAELADLIQFSRDAMPDRAAPEHAVDLILLITDLTRRARVDLFGPIGPATACACNTPEGDTHLTWCPAGPKAMYP